jgi:hypothetical protein
MTVEGKGGPPFKVDMTDAATIEKVRFFGQVAATQKEMAYYFQTHLSTIEKYMSEKDPDNLSEFLRVYKSAESNTKISLRRDQIEKAKSGDNTMLIWMGKQLLDQKEKNESKITQSVERYPVDPTDAKF